jgi:hypothetical protein
MYDESFSEAVREWKESFAAWEDGINASFNRPRTAEETEEYWEYGGGPPDRVFYRPDWPEEARTHYQMYENVSEGTPISPPMPSPESLAQWLADNDANAGAGATASYEAWLRICQGGYAPSMIVRAGVVEDGVNAMHRMSGGTS